LKYIDPAFIQQGAIAAMFPGHTLVYIFADPQNNIRQFVLTWIR